MSGRMKYDPTTCTTVLSWEWRKPLSMEDEQLLERLLDRGAEIGYTLLKAETAHAVRLTAVLTAPKTQPFTPVRTLVPGAVVSALVGEATAEER